MITNTGVMSSYLRPRHPGATIYFEVCLQDPHATLLTDKIDQLRSAVGLTRRTRPFHVDAWVVLPNQMHAIWTLPDGDFDYPTRWRQIKSRFSRGLPRAPRTASQLARRERGIWQRRNWEHHIASQSDYRTHMEICRTLPTRRGLCDHPADWPYSSFHRQAVGCVLARTVPSPHELKAWDGRPNHH